MAKTTSSVPSLATLPREIQVKVIKCLPMRDRWSLMGVNKRLRSVNRGFPELWRHLDLSATKQIHRAECFQQMTKLANYSSTSMDYLFTPKPQAPEPADVHPYLCFEDIQLLSDIFQSVPGLIDLRVDVDVLHHYQYQGFKPPTNLQIIDIIGRVVSRSALAGLNAMTGLQNVTIRDWRVNRLAGFPFRFPFHSHTLKRLKLHFDNPYGYGPSQLFSIMGIESALPSLEALELSGLRGINSNCPPSAYAQHSSGLTLQPLTHLKEATFIYDGECYPLPMFNLPQSVEKLACISDGPQLLDGLYVDDNAPPPHSIFNVPNLRELEVTFDIILEDEGSSFWVSVVEHSGCKLESLKLSHATETTLAAAPASSKKVAPLDNGEATWASNLVIDLAQGGHLQHLHQLELDVSRGLEGHCEVVEAIAQHCPNLEKSFWNGSCKIDEQSIVKLIGMPVLSRLQVNANQHAEGFVGKVKMLGVVVTTR